MLKPTLKKFTSGCKRTILKYNTSMPEAEEEKIEPAPIPLEPKKIFFWEGLLFFLTQIFGVITSWKITKIPEIEIEKIPLKLSSLWEILTSFAVLILLILLLIRFLKFRPGKEILFKIFFILPVFLGGMVFWSLWFGDLLALISVLFFIIWWLKKPNVLVHNFLLLSGMIGLGALFGLRLDPLLVIILLIIFSVYDIIAVYKTKHMIKMAKEMIEAKAISGIVLPPKLSEIQAPLKDLKIGGRFLILGGGDIVFPLLLVSSLVPEGILKSLIVAIFATFGLLVSIFIFLFQKTRKPIPALPPIAFFSIIGYLITKLI